jgi:putative lipoic acid-binding regulatory protein
VTDIFLSYAKEDRERARNLATALEAAGWSVWWDRNIQVGQAFDQAIENALDSAKCVVVLWSKHSISSEWVKNEAASAADSGKLVPALIDDVRLPLEFRRKQTANLIGWEQEPSHPGFQALCGGIAAAAGSPQAARPSDVSPRQQAGTRRGRRVIAGTAVLAAALAGGAYFAVRQLRSPVAERPTAEVPASGLEAGVFDFTWPGMDCWEIDRREAKVAGTCGAGKQALQTGRYTVKPSSSGVFLPFQIAIKPNTVTTADAMAGTLDFKWPGMDCWEIDRGETKVTGTCGGGKQALQAGTYTVKPSSSGVFLPFRITVKAKTTTTADAMAGMLHFKWPGMDCWEIDRGEAKAAGSCGSGHQALQAGMYTVKPIGNAPFKPFKISVLKGQTLTVP